MDKETDTNYTTGKDNNLRKPTRNRLVEDKFEILCRDICSFSKDDKYQTPKFCEEENTCIYQIARGGIMQSLLRD